MPRYRPKVGKETKEIAQIPFHNRKISKIYSILAKSSCAKLSRPGYLLRTDFSHFTLQGKSWASSLFKFNYQSRSTEVERQEAFGQHFTTSRRANSGLKNSYSNRSRYAAHNYKPFSEMCGLRQEILLARKGNKGRIQPLLATAPSSRDPFSLASRCCSSNNMLLHTSLQCPVILIQGSLSNLHRIDC